MKELTINKDYIDAYDIYVNHYLTSEQISSIINAMHGYETYGDRIKVRDLMILAYCTDIPHEQIDEIGHDMFVQSGLMFEVLCRVENLDDITEGLKWSEGLANTIIQVSKRLPELEEKLKELSVANDKLTKTKGE